MRYEVVLGEVVPDSVIEPSFPVYDKNQNFLGIVYMDSLVYSFFPKEETILRVYNNNHADLISLYIKDDPDALSRLSIHGI